MAVRRIWFPNAPDNQNTLSDRMQYGVHVSITSSELENFLQYDYLRRYLGDPIAVLETGPSETPDEVDETAFTYYIRRYLCDPVTESPYSIFGEEEIATLEWALSGNNKGLLVCPAETPFTGEPPRDGNCGHEG